MNFSIETISRETWEPIWLRTQAARERISAGTHSEAAQVILADADLDDDPEDVAARDDTAWDALVAAAQTERDHNSTVLRSILAQMEARTAALPPFAWRFGREPHHVVTLPTRTLHEAYQASLTQRDTALTEEVAADAEWITDREAAIDAKIEAQRVANGHYNDDYTPALVNRPMPRKAVEYNDISAIVGGIDGLLKVFVDYVVATARSPQPFLALGAGLCCIGAAAGRRYRSETDIRTNPMIIGLADSGGGKERPRECLADAFVQAGMTEYLGGSRIGSSAGLLTAVKDHPVVLFALDEIGHMLGINAGKNAGAHKAEILPLFTELWSRAGGQYFGTNYGDSKLLPKVVLHQPHVVLFGVTVPGVLWKAFGSGALSDGSLARFLVFESPESYPDKQRPASSPMPEALTAGLRRIAGTVPSGIGNLAGYRPRMDSAVAEVARVVPCDAAAEALLDALTAEELALQRQHRGTPQTAFWARWWEHTVRVAMIRAIGRDHETPLIGADDVKWARALTLHCVRHLLAQVADHVSDNQWEANRKVVAAFIRDAGRAVTAMELGRGLRQIDAKSRAMILTDLVGLGEVAMTSEQSGGRPTKAFTWLG